MVHSDAQKEATARCNKKAYNFIGVVAPKDKRMNRFINGAIDAQMKSGTEKE